MTAIAPASIERELTALPGPEAVLPGTTRAYLTDATESMSIESNLEEQRPHRARRGGREPHRHGPVARLGAAGEACHGHAGCGRLTARKTVRDAAGAPLRRPASGCSHPAC